MIYKTKHIPPSVNAMYKNAKKGRVKVRAYKDWIFLATLDLNPIIPINDGAYELYIKIPQKTRGDIDNRIKAISDLLVSVGATPDDRYMDLCQIKRADVEQVEIEVVAKS